MREMSDTDREADIEKTHLKTVLLWELWASWSLINRKQLLFYFLNLYTLLMWIFPALLISAIDSVH